MKLDLKQHWLPLIKSLPNNICLIPPALLIASVFMIVAATTSTRQLVAQLSTAVTTPQGKSIDLEKLPLKAVEYQSYLASMRRLSPVVRFEIPRGGDAIEVSVESADNYAEFIYALSTMQSYSDAVVWEATEICIAGCEGSAAKATIKGFKQRFTVG